MPARRGALRRKRGAPASSGPKRKKKVAAKKTQVTLAAEKAKTPQEIARDIMIKNGLLPAAATTTQASILNREVGSTTPVKEKWGIAVVSRSPEMLTREQQERIEDRRRAALERRRLPSCSPGVLTKEQRERIEKRRQEALKKRKYALHSAGMNTVHPVAADLAPDTGKGEQLSVAPLHYRQHQSRSWIEPSSTARQRSRVVTPENLPTANPTAEVEQARPDFFWDDLEAAAEIVQWENERMAKVALVRPPVSTPSRELDTTEYGLGQQTHQGRAEAQRPAVSTIPSLSQELAAAAEIIEWEKKNEVSPEKSAFSRSVDSPFNESEVQAPQFQLLPVHITDDFEKHESNAKHPNLNPKPKSKSHRKRPLVAEPSPALSHSNPDGENQRNSTSSHPSETHPNPAAFLEKHIREVEDKLELPVLEFLDMMLA
ncbi:hypothetical protein V7S43_002781 [Phytophthora oleae]|uniref:Uncharacterized protein n=1 Tax=Phytophthora oleae TaxID=2107226 RepID=A0ABD3FZA1_9STRA